MIFWVVFIFSSILGVVSKKVKPILIIQVSKTQGLLLAKGTQSTKQLSLQVLLQERHLSTEALKVLGCGKIVHSEKPDIFPASSDSTLNSIFSIYPDDQTPCFFFIKQILLIFHSPPKLTFNSFLLESCLF